MKSIFLRTRHDRAARKNRGPRYRRTGWTAALLAAIALSGATGAGQSHSGGTLLVANKTDRTMSVIDTAAGKAVHAVPETGATGHELTASPDGKVAYVPIYGDSGVGRPGSDGQNMMVIDIASGKTVGNVDFGKGVRPHCPVIGPKNGLVYVTTELDQTVSIIDPKTLKIVGTVPTGANESHMLAISRDGKRGYTANVGPGTVSVLDLDAKKTVAVIPISAKKTQRIALSVDGKLAWTADQGEPRLAAIDTTTNKVDHWIPLPAVGFSTAPTPDGKFLVVTSIAANKVFVVDLKTKAVAHTLDMPRIPQEVIVRPDGKMAYVSCDIEAKVVAVRTSDWKVDATWDAGKGADGLAWAGK
jgi:YVTN family beta-propeller protein